MSCRETEVTHVFTIIKSPVSMVGYYLIPGRVKLEVVFTYIVFP